MTRHRETPTWVPVTQDSLRNLQPGVVAGGVVQTFNTRTGAVVLTSLDVTDALGFIPAASAGSGITDGDYGDVIVSGGGTIMMLDSGVVTTFARTMLDDTTAAGVRATLGLGSLALQNTINNADWSGADLSVANGGTGASTAPAARTSLDLYSTAEVDALVAGGGGGGAIIEIDGGDASNSGTAYLELDGGTA